MFVLILFDFLPFYISAYTTLNKLLAVFYYARKQNASRVFAIVCPSVRHTRDLYQNGAS